MESDSAHRHEYAVQVVWEGNRGGGTSSYAAYGREHRILVAGKPALAGSADPTFRGDPARHNPEDLFVASLSACHMLTYLALCARAGIVVTAYADDAGGTMTVDRDGGGRFVEVVLRPRVEIADAAAAARAAALHDDAHHQCFIANSCSIPVRHEAEIVVRAAPPSPGPSPAAGDRP